VSFGISFYTSEVDGWAPCTASSRKTLSPNRIKEGKKKKSLKLQFRDQLLLLSFLSQAKEAMQLDVLL